MPIKISRSVYDTLPPDLLAQALLGDNKSNTLTGSTTKTVFFGGGGNDKIIGKAGVTNTAVYTYSIDKYQITTTKDGITVKALSGNEGTDTLINVSQVMFAGVTYQVQPTTVGAPATVTLATAPSTEPTPIPPVSSDPAPSTPTPSDPAPTTPVSSDPAPSTPTPSDPAPTTPVSSDPAPSTPTPSDPAPTTPVSSDPAPSTPTPSDPAPTTPVSSDPAPSTPTPSEPTPTTPVSSDPAPTTPTPSDPAPATPTSGNVVSFSLQNTSGASEGTGYVTFGQVFEKGSVMPGDTLVATINGQNVAVQMDVKTTNPDGSVGHAILTMKAPAIAAGGSVDGTLAKGSASAGTAIQAQDIVQHGYNFKVDVTLHNADGSTTVKSIDAAQLLQQSINNGSVETWLKGSQASEYRITANVAPNLDVKLDIRMDADGKTHTDVIFARDDAYSTNISNLNYDVKFTQDGQTVFSQANIQQYGYSTWHQAISSSGSIDPQVVYDMAYLIKTGAVPAYDLSTGVSPDAIAGTVQALAQSNTDPMGNALVQKYIPGPGGRADIGPETTWTANYLISQNADAAKVMYANADASGSVPWHLIDTNGDPLRADLHPDLWVDWRGERYADHLPGGFNIDSTGWMTDVAHQPALTYVPYLLSGTHYYLDELQAQASYTILSVDPAYRGHGDAVLSDLANQIRALAWGLRDISNAAYITPDADAMKAYYTKMLDNSLDYLINTYVNGPEGDKQGQLEGYIRSGVTNDIAPWQEDYLAISLQYLADKGFTKADTLLNWMDNFISGRFLNEASGYDPLHGTTYYLTTINPATGEVYKTWAEVYQATFGSAPATGFDDGSYPAWAGGYAANAKAALASMISANQSPDAIEAYGWLQSQTTAMKESYKSDPTWNIAPKLANGEYLTNDEVSVLSSTTGGTMTAGNGEQMLIGNIGNDTIVGGSGIAMLFGMDGNDTLKAGSGNSYLYGGDGNDRLQDGAGANYFKGGTGADVFAFASASTGRDTIADFTKGTDRIEIKSNLNGSGITTAAQIVASATADADGNAVLHLGPQHDIVLQGVMLNQLTTDIFTIV